MPSVFSDGKGNGNPGFVHAFSRIAPIYEKKCGTKLSQAHDECLRILSRWLCTSRPEPVLDIGRGTSALIERKFAQWPDACFEGVDPAQGMVGMDVVEVAPAYDSAEITSLAAATLAMEMLCLYAARHKVDK